MAFELVKEFARDPLGWGGQFGRNLRDEVVAQRPAKAIGKTIVAAPGFVLDKSVGAVESLPFDSGLIFTQIVRDPFEFGHQFVGVFPDEQRKSIERAAIFANDNPVSGLMKWAVVGLVVVMLFPALFAVSRRVGRVV